MSKVIFSLLFILILGFDSYAQILRTYTGEYKYINSPTLTQCGKANYTYYSIEDKRMFHGSFSYKDKWCSVKGKFIDNKQDGIWTFSRWINFYTKKKYYNGNLVISVSYSNGVPDGPFSLSLVDEKTKRTINYIKGNISVDKLIGDISGDLNSRLFNDNYDNLVNGPFQTKISGTFNDNGKPIGKWILSNSIRQITQSNFKNGEYDVEIYDPSTGDKLENNVNAFLPNIIVNAANYALRLTRMRDSDEIIIPMFIEDGYWYPGETYQGF